MIAIEIAAWLVAAPAVAWCGYLGFLSILAGRPKPPKYSEAKTRFAIVVPAHNEGENVTNTVNNLAAIDYPKDHYEVVVIADNCNDDTAERARAEGVTVIERQNAELRGKGYAVEVAFDTLLARTNPPDAVVVVDADTVVDPHLLFAYQARLEAGELAVQADYAVSNPESSWRTRLMAVALGMFHGARSFGRERLKVSTGLRGNGMCFAQETLRKVPHKAYGLVEDVEYGIALARAGIRVAYVGEAHVYGEMVSGGEASVSQRRRWEEGRLGLVRVHLWPLVRDGLRQRSGMLLDLATDIAIPPLSYVGLLCLIGLAYSGAAWWFELPLRPTIAWGFAWGALSLYVLRGLQYSGLGFFRAAFTLAYAPFYVMWKVVIARPFKTKNKEWVRTERESKP